ncbi:hypothetical protein I552_2872 [Mycobacterium xenopi 3993]|nr:hypothetical protein I552_2872 [Mycobacterium xenopi 3993]
MTTVKSVTSLRRIARTNAIGLRRDPSRRCRWSCRYAVQRRRRPEWFSYRS